MELPFFEFENLFSDTEFKIEADAVMTCQELPSTPDWPPDLTLEHCIQRDQSINFGMRITKSGLACLNPNHWWRGEIHLEKQGGDEYDLPASIKVKWEPYGDVLMGYHTWTLSFSTVPAYTIPVGLYRVTGTIQLCGPGPENTPIRQAVIGFADMGLLQVYED